MVLNMTELPLMSWSPEQLDAARKLCTDGVLHDWALPTILPGDSHSNVIDLAWAADDIVRTMKPEAVIIQGEPVFVYNVVRSFESWHRPIPCYSPCYKDGKFVQFRRF